MRHGLFVVHHELIVLVKVYLTLLAHLVFLLFAPTRLYSVMFVHLSLEDTELVVLGFRRHSEFTVA